MLAPFFGIDTIVFFFLIITTLFVSVNRKEKKLTFSEHLLQLRKEKGLKQTELARSIDISWRAYQTYERGEREPQMSTLVALADFYDISLDELVCREWPKKLEEH